MSTKPNSFPSSGIENALFLITLGMGKTFFFQCDLLTPILETFVRYGLSLQIPPTYFSVLVSSFLPGRALANGQRRIVLSECNGLSVLCL